MGSIEHTGTMRAVQGAAIGLLAAVLCIGVVAYVHSGDQGTEQELADNSVLGSAVSSIKDTFSQLALGRIHITHKKRRYKSKGAALFDKPGPSKAPVAAECPDGDVLLCQAHGHAQGSCQAREFSGRHLGEWHRRFHANGDWSDPVSCQPL